MIKNYNKLRREKMKKLGLCPSCTKNKPQSGRSVCEDCLISKKIRGTFWGKAEYHEQIKRQGNKCLICRIVLTRPHIDHDHENGQIRGILCASCNVGLGMFKENPKLLLAAADYLKYPEYIKPRR